jgi:hypothetical protein
VYSRGSPCGYPGKVNMLDEQLQLLKELAELIRSQIISHDRHSIIELEGLGKEVWSGVDVEKYIDEERNSRDG